MGKIDLVQNTLCAYVKFSNNKENVLNISLYLLGVCVCMSTYVCTCSHKHTCHRTHVKVKGQLEEIMSLLNM